MKSIERIKQDKIKSMTKSLEEYIEELEKNKKSKGEHKLSKRKQKKNKNKYNNDEEIYVYNTKNFKKEKKIENL